MATTTPPTAPARSRRLAATVRRTWRAVESRAGSDAVELTFLVLFTVGVLVAALLTAGGPVRPTDVVLYLVIAAVAYAVSRALAWWAGRGDVDDTA